MKKIKKSGDFAVVGVGASAGGLAAIEEFFSECPEKPGMSFVVIQHLSPDYKSYMPDILSKKNQDQGGLD